MFKILKPTLMNQNNGSSGSSSNSGNMGTSGNSSNMDNGGSGSSTGNGSNSENNNIGNGGNTGNGGSGNGGSNSNTGGSSNTEPEHSENPTTGSNNGGNSSNTGNNGNTGNGGNSGSNGNMGNGGNSNNTGNNGNTGNGGSGNTNNGGNGNNGGMSNGGMGGAACYTYPDAPATEGLTTPDIQFNRTIYMNGSMTMDDGNTVSIWGFADSSNGSGGMGGASTFPSAPIRVTQDQVVHTVLDNSMGMWLHTVHHHGIEPSTENDGVGHYSFDVNGIYTYQWIASHPGTYFYHCHTNTVLHAEMGMYGALIIDPPEGQGILYSGGPAYDVEAIWACDEIDSSWHVSAMDWASGTCEGDDRGRNSLNPDYFIISGVDGANSALTDPSVAVTMNAGETLLVRYICAGFLPQRITFGGLTATIHISDGRVLPKPVDVQSLDTSSAERYDFIIQPDTAGVYEVTIDTLDWVTGKVLGTARTRITVV